MDLICHKCGKKIGYIDDGIYYFSPYTHPDEEYEDQYLRPYDNMFICRDCAIKEIGEYRMMCKDYAEKEKTEAKK